MRFAIIVLFVLLTYHVGIAQFTKLQNSPAVNEILESSGIAWIDFDSDGDDDIFVTTSTLANAPGIDLLFVNNGDGTFTRHLTGELVNTEQGPSRSSTWADYNNDGLTDVLVVNQLYLSLFKNTPSGEFTKIVQPPTTNIPTFDQDFSSASWGDYNGDGFLDLVVAAYRLNSNGKNVLFKNNKDGSFEAIVGSDFANTSALSLDVTWIDYNNDQLLDLFITNYGEPSFLFRNKGDGTFQKMNINGLTTIPALGVGSSWADYDNDGDFDVVIVVNANSNNLFFENNGDGTFTEKSNAITSLQATSSAWADFDNDGFIDLVLVGNTANRKTYLLKNNGNKTFTDVSLQQGINNANYSQGAAWGDYNKDGFLDLFIANGYADDLSSNDILYVNTPNLNKWISIKLIGNKSNKSAIGTVTRIKANGKWLTQVIQSQTGKNSQNSLNIEFGLGSASTIDTLLITWPLKGYQEFTNVTPNQFIEIEEVDFLSAPSALTGSNTSYKQINLSWNDNSVGESGFRIERSVGNDRNFKLVGTTPTDVTSFQDDAVQEGITYYYRIAANQNNGFSLYSNVFTIYSKKNQTVTFEPIGEKYLDSEPFKLLATASSGLVPSFAIIDGNDKVSLSGDVLTILGLGVSKIGAFQTGNDAYFPSPITEQVLEVIFITEVKKDSGKLTFYPNPVNNEIVISSAGHLRIKIVNSVGVIMDLVDLTPGISTQSLDSFPSGVYFILSEFGVHKFVKVN